MGITCDIGQLLTKLCPLEEPKWEASAEIHKRDIIIFSDRELGNKIGIILDMM